MTIAEQIRQEERSLILRQVLTLKCGDPTPEQEQVIARATPEELKRYIGRAVTAEDASDVFDA